MTLRVVLAGDCIVTRGALVTAHPRSAELRDLIRSADFAFANLEVLPNDFRGYPVAHPDGAHLVTGSWVIDEILDAGFSAVGCANNHALDLGVEGLLATIEVLDARGLPFAGIGRNLSEARMPVYVDRPEGSLAVISCSATFRPWQAASYQGLEVQGRPGLNPLRHTMTLLVTAERMEALRAIDRETGLDRSRAGVIDLVRVPRVVQPPADDGDVFRFLGQAFRRISTKSPAGCKTPASARTSSWSASTATSRARPLRRPPTSCASSLTGWSTRALTRWSGTGPTSSAASRSTRGSRSSTASGTWSARLTWSPGCPMRATTP